MIFDEKYNFLTEDTWGTISGSLQNNIDKYAPQVIQLYNTTSGSLAYGEAINWDYEYIKDSDYYAHTTSGTEIEILKNGLYRVEYSIVWSCSNEEEVFFDSYICLNSGTLNGSRAVAHSDSSASIGDVYEIFYKSFNKNDIIELCINSDEENVYTGASLVPNKSNISLELLREL